MPEAATERVRAAIANTDPTYLYGTLKIRAGLCRKHPGSVASGVTPKQLLELIQTVEWEPYAHPDIATHCAAFKAPIPGMLGLADLRHLPADIPVFLEEHKESGIISAVVAGAPAEKVEYSVIILGNVKTGKGEFREEVLNFYSGGPVRPSHISAAHCPSAEITVKEALEMGFELAKIG